MPIRLFFIFLLTFLNLMTDLPSDNWINYFLAGGFILTFILLDFFIVPKVPFFRIFTTLITFLIITSSLFFIKDVFNINLLLFAGQEKLGELFLINILLISFFFAVRLGATSSYFEKIKEENEINNKNQFYILDTSAIIDGRVIDICEADFLSPYLLIPDFVIKELQLISDSTNHEKRKKGRRGLDLLGRMKNSDKLSIQIIGDDYPDVKGVDNKLLYLAKDMDSHIITTDFNLMRVAEVEEIKVINVNQIATILKPPYKVGDKFKVSVVKKGNNEQQGIAYLEDDTMVVVENGEKFIGQLKQVMVTSYIQSSSGKMAFCKIINNSSN